jgi:hypothetical protein
MISEKKKAKISAREASSDPLWALAKSAFRRGRSLRHVGKRSARRAQLLCPTRRIAKRKTAHIYPNQGTIPARTCWQAHIITFRRTAMKTLTTTILASAAGTLFMTAASAAPLSAGASVAARAVASNSDIQNVRMVCNEDGRCWRERGERRVIIHENRDAYDYAPRERYIERRTYDDRRYEDRGGIGIRAPGVSVGIGSDY